MVLIMLFLHTVVHAQSGLADTLTQYLFPKFSKSLITTKGGGSYDLMLNYNIITEKMVFERNGKYFDLANTGTIDTIYLENRKFIPENEYFADVLVSGKVSFFIRHKGKLTAPQSPGGYGTTAQMNTANLIKGLSTPTGYYNFRLPDGYTVRKTSSVWIRKDDKWTMISGENQILKLFPGMENKLKAFIKENKLHISRREELIKIGNFCNEIAK